MGEGRQSAALFAARPSRSAESSIARIYGVAVGSATKRADFPPREKGAGARYRVCARICCSRGHLLSAPPCCKEAAAFLRSLTAERTGRAYSSYSTSSPRPAPVGYCLDEQGRSVPFRPLNRFPGLSERSAQVRKYGIASVLLKRRSRAITAAAQASGAMAGV